MDPKQSFLVKLKWKVEQTINNLGECKSYLNSHMRNRCYDLRDTHCVCGP